MDFSTEEDEILIDLVRVNPQLYETTLEAYRNTQLKDVIWKDIGKELNKTSEDCKRRWKHIKDSYNRFKRKNKARGSINPKKSKWQIYNKLSFLETCCNNTLHICKTGEHQGCRTAEVVVNIKQHNSDTDEQLQDDSNSTGLVVNEEVFLDETATNYESETSTGANKRRRRIKDESKYTAPNYFKNMTDNPEPLLNNIIQKNDEDIGSFCSHIGDVLKSLPPIYKIRAKQEIFNILTNYEIMVAENSNNLIQFSSS